MQDSENKNSIGHFAALAGLWLINILIVVSATPFFIYRALRRITTKSSKNAASQINTPEKSTRYFPCSIE